MKARILYFYASLSLAAFFILVYLLHSSLNWSAFSNAAAVFLPMALGLIFAAVLLFAGIYLMIKGFNRGKEKKHVRYL